jgi:hypothetical protein
MTMLRRVELAEQRATGVIPYHLHFRWGRDLPHGAL